MKKEQYISTLIVIIVYGLIISMIRVQFAFKDDGLSTTSTPNEATSQHLLIKNVTPDLKEIPYDQNTDLIIENAWLEKSFLRENRIFWIKKTLDTDECLFKIKYSFKNKSTGNKFYNTMNTVLLESTSSDDNVTIGSGEAIGLFIRSNSINKFEVKIYNGVNEGKIVSFH